MGQRPDVAEHILLLCADLQLVVYSSFGVHGPWIVQFHQEIEVAGVGQDTAICLFRGVSGSLPPSFAFSFSVEEVDFVVGAEAQV